MDDSAALVVEQLIEIAVEEDTECIVMGVKDRRIDSVEALGVLHLVGDDRFVDTLDEARRLARDLLSSR